MRKRPNKNKPIVKANHDINEKLSKVNDKTIVKEKLNEESNQ